MKKDRVFKYSCLVVLSIFFLRIAVAQNNRPIINASLSGTVIDANTKNPIEGVTLRLDGVTHSVQTDRSGNFQFVTGQKLPFKVVVSYVGYKTQTLVISSSPAIIALAPLENTLEETVVVAYGQSKIKDLTGSLTRLSEADVQNAPMGTSIQSLLQGKAAGVNVNIQSASPTSPVSVIIRGASSLTGNNQPLWVIDGVPG